MADVQPPWPANPRAVLAAMYANRPAGGLGEAVTFGGQGNMIPGIPFDQIGTPAHTGIYRQDNGQTWINSDARIPDGWELFGPTLGKQVGGGEGSSVVQCIIKIADRDRIRYVPPREKVPQQWIAVRIERSQDLPDLFNQGWQIYETPFFADGMIYVTLVKSPRAIPPVPPVPVPAVAPAAVNVNVPPNVPAPPQGGTRRRKRNRKVHSKTNTK
jgi:hypothetical protein